MHEITITIDDVDDCTADWCPHVLGFVTLDMLVLFTAKHEWLDGDAEPDVVEMAIGAKVDLHNGTPIRIELEPVAHATRFPQWLGVNDPALRAAIMRAAPEQAEAEHERSLTAYEARYS